MDSIFHERQEGSLCAQHCLNALLQGSYFTAVDLARFARELDEDERQKMAEGDVNSDEYKTFLKWFNLNSLLTGPELLSDTHLGLFLAQLQTEGYSIFVVQGHLPNSQADEILSYHPAVQTMRPHVIREDWDDPQQRTGGNFNKEHAPTAGKGRQQSWDDFVLFGSRNRAEAVAVETRPHRLVGQRDRHDEKIDLATKGLVERTNRSLHEVEAERIYPMSVATARAQQPRTEASGLAGAAASSPVSGLTMPAINNALAFSISQVLGHGFPSQSQGQGRDSLPTERYSDLPFQQRYPPVRPHSGTSWDPRGQSSLPSLPPLDVPLTSLSTVPMVHLSPEETNHDSNEEDSSMAFNIQVEAPLGYNQRDSNPVEDLIKDSTKDAVEDDDSYIAHLDEPESESEDEESSSESWLYSGKTRRQVSEMTEEEMMSMAMQLSQNQTEHDGKDNGGEASD